jgi:hypothetical protein
MPAAPAGAGAVPSGAMPAGAPAGGIGSGPPQGPPAWNEKWRQKFLDLGLPPEQVSQLIASGAMGADEQQIQYSYDELKGMVDAEFAKFKKQHGEIYEKLEASPMMDRAYLLQIAQASNAGQLPEEELTGLADASGGMGKMMGDMALKTMLPWAVIPGWGLLRYAAGVPLAGDGIEIAGMNLFGGKDPISKFPIHYDFWNHGGMDGAMGFFDAAMAIGGAFTGRAIFRHFGQATRGAQLAMNNPMLKGLAQSRGINLNGIGKYNMFSEAGRFSAGASHVTPQLGKAIEALPAAERASAMRTLEFGLTNGFSGVPSLNVTPMGMFAGGRNAMTGRSAPMVSVQARNGVTGVHIDGRANPQLLAADFAKAGVGLLDRQSLTAAISQMRVPKGVQVADPRKMYEHQMFGSAIRSDSQLTAQIQQRNQSVLGRLADKLRPGHMADGRTALNNAAPQPGLVQRTFEKYPALNKPAVKWGVGIPLGGAAVYGVGKMMTPKPPAEEQAAAGGGQGKMTKEFKAEAEQFMQLPPDQQMLYLEEQNAQLEQAAQNPQMTPEEQKVLESRMGELEMLAQAAQQAGAGGAAAPAPTGAMPAA